MITTLFFLQLIGFQLWHITSKQVKLTNPSGFVTGIRENVQRYRIIGAALVIVATIVFVVQWGWMTGLCAAITGLMGVGSLVVALHPFRYINEKGLLLLYVLFLVLEIFI